MEYLDPTGRNRRPVKLTFSRLMTYEYIQSDSRLVDITAGGDQKSSYKHVSDFGRLRSYDRLKLGIEGNDY